MRTDGPTTANVMDIPLFPTALIMNERGERLTIMKGKSYEGLTNNNLRYSLVRYMPFSDLVESLRRVLI